MKIELYCGEQYSLKLGGLGSAGYIWGFIINGSQDVIHIYETVGSHPANIKYQIPQNYEIDHTFVIKAQKQGTVMVRFDLKRPWEKKVSPIRTKLVWITVFK